MPEAPLIGQLRSLAERFDTELSQVSTGLADLVRHCLPLIIGELDAVAAHAESATAVILDACETLEDTAGRHDGAGAASTRIYEACGFQDIVGQRLAKAVGTLRQVEESAAMMLRALGPAPERAGPWQTPPLSGPQGATAIDQHVVDAILAGGA